MSLCFHANYVAVLQHSYYECVPFILKMSHFDLLPVLCTKSSQSDPRMHECGQRELGHFWAYLSLTVIKY